MPLPRSPFNADLRHHARSRLLPTFFYAMKVCLQDQIGSGNASFICKNRFIKSGGFKSVFHPIFSSFACILSLRPMEKEFSAPCILCLSEVMRSLEKVFIRTRSRNETWPREFLAAVVEILHNTQSVSNYYFSVLYYSGA